MISRNCTVCGRLFHAVNFLAHKQVVTCSNECNRINRRLTMQRKRGIKSIERILSKNPDLKKFWNPLA